MSDAHHTPAVGYIDGKPTYDWHEPILSPRNIIALVIVAALVSTAFAPYFFNVPNGRAGDLIVTGSKVLETIGVLVIGYFFGTTVSSSKKDETIRQQAMAAPQGTGSGAPIVVEPPATLKIEEPHGPSTDAPRPAEEAAAPPGPSRPQPRDIRPPE